MEHLSVIAHWNQNKKIYRMGSKKRLPVAKESMVGDLPFSLVKNDFN